MKTAIIAAITAAAALAALILTVRHGGPQHAAAGAFCAFIVAALALATAIEDAIDDARERREMTRRVIWPAHLREARK